MISVKWYGETESLPRWSISVTYGRKTWPSYSERIWFFGAE